MTEQKRPKQPTCPECGGPLNHASGCVECPVCGYARCG